MNIYILQKTTFTAKGAIAEVEILEAFRNFEDACKAMDEYAELGEGERFGLSHKGKNNYRIDIEAELAAACDTGEGSGEYAVRYVLEVSQIYLN